jgi:hypothetical protein
MKFQILLKSGLFFLMEMEIKDNDEELKSNIMEFIKAPIGYSNLTTEFHPQACYTSRLYNFTSELNKILESECLDDCIINEMNSLSM